MELRARSQLASRLILLGLISLIVGAPIAIGAVHLVTYSAMEVLIFCLLLIHLWTTDFSRSSIYLRRTLLLMLPFFLFLLFCLFQMVPLPFSFLQRFSPGTAGLYARLGLSGPMLPVSLSISAGSGTLLKWFAYGSAFFLAAMFAPPDGGPSSRACCIQLLTAFFAIGFLEAVYGLYGSLNHSQHLLWFKKKYYTDCVTGTYINRNHFAGLMNLCIPVSVGLLASRLDLRSVRRSALSLYFLFLGLLVMVLGLIFSVSRMGQLSLIAGGGFVGALCIASLTKRKRRKDRTILLAPVLVICLGCLWGLWKGLGPVEDRWSAIEASYEDRSVVWHSTLRLFRDFPLVGTGIGTYQLAYPPYKSVKLGPTIMDHAHNDYLEFLSELGLAGFIPWCAFFVLFLIFTAAAWFRRRNAFSVSIGAGGLVGVLAFLIHSMADFNLQIPANATLLFLVMGLTWRAVNSSTAQKGMVRPLDRYGARSSLSFCFPLSTFPLSGWPVNSSRPRT